MSRNRTIWREITRRLMGLFVLTGLCAAVAPIPITFAPPALDGSEKDLTQPFPCMNRPCGCRSADECWKKCCCFTDTQKVAWAKANRVAIPDFVIAAAAKEVTKTKTVTYHKTSPTGDCPHCAVNKETAAPAAKKTADHEGPISFAVATIRKVAHSANFRVSCCNSESTERQLAEKLAPVAIPQPLVRTKWVLAVHAAQCQGQSIFWLTLPPAVVPEWPHISNVPQGTFESLQLVSERLPETSSRPPIPPPRIA